MVRYDIPDTVCQHTENGAPVNGAQDVTLGGRARRAGGPGVEEMAGEESGHVDN